MGVEGRTDVRLGLRESDGNHAELETVECSWERKGRDHHGRRWQRAGRRCVDFETREATHILVRHRTIEVVFQEISSIRGNMVNWGSAIDSTKCELCVNVMLLSIHGEVVLVDGLYSHFRFYTRSLRLAPSSRRDPV